MTQNIEQRTEVAVTKYENASNVAEKLVNTDSVVSTPVGDRESFPMISRLETESRLKRDNEFSADQESRDKAFGESQSLRSQDFDRENAERDNEFQSRFSVSQQAINWLPNTPVLDKFQRYFVGVVGESDYKEYLPDPDKLPFTTLTSIDDDLSQGYWLENGVASKSDVKLLINQRITQLFGQPNLLTNGEWIEGAECESGACVVYSDGSIWLSETTIIMGSSPYLGAGFHKIEKPIFINCEALKRASVTPGIIVKTLGYYHPNNIGQASYFIMSLSQYINLYGNNPDGYCDFEIGNSNVAVLNLMIDGYCEFEQVGIKVFESESDNEFNSVDAGIILNSLNLNRRLIGLKSSKYGRVHCQTQYIDTKGMYFESPKQELVDTVNEKSFKLVFHKDTTITDVLGGAFTVKSGVRKGGISGMLIKEADDATITKGFCLGNAYYEVDTKNIVSGYKLKDFITQGFNFGVFGYQYFACSFEDAHPRDFRQIGWFTEEGGTSCTWIRCLPLSKEPNARGFAWKDDQLRQGHIYSTMIDCCPQLCSGTAYIFRNCSLSLINCSEEFCSGEQTMLFIGTGNYNISNYNLLNTNDDKPKYIYGVKPSPNGRFGATLIINGTSLSVNDFSGDKVKFMRYVSEPTTILSSARWDISNVNGKSDPTDSLDFESWKEGYYYEKFVILKDQLDKIEIYSRNNHDVATIPLKTKTHYEIIGDITAGGFGAFFSLEVQTGRKIFLTIPDAVDIFETALSDPSGRGKVFHIDSGNNNVLATGNLYLRAHEQAGCKVFAYFVNGAINIELRASDGSTLLQQSGKYTIKTSASAGLN